MKKIVPIVMLLGLSACATPGYYVAGPSPQAYQGAAVGAAVGATAGALLDRKNRWRGAVIGAGLGGLFGGATAHISSQPHRSRYRPYPGYQGY